MVLTLLVTLLPVVLPVTPLVQMQLVVAVVLVLLQQALRLGHSYHAALFHFKWEVDFKPPTMARASYKGAMLAIIRSTLLA